MKSAKISSFLNKIRKSNFDFYKYKYYFFIAPLVIILVGVILISTIGFNTGIDFTGGTVTNIVTQTDLTDITEFDSAKTKVNTVLENNGLVASYFQTAQTDNGIAISFKYQDKPGLSEGEMNILNDLVREQLFDAFELDINSDSHLIQSAQRIGATASSELLYIALIAILVSFVLLLIYIAFRFELTSGLTTVICLIVDVLVMSSLVLIFRIQINSSFIAALITIIGYTINNTIIIFDRIRENRKTVYDINTPNSVISNISVKQTLTRTINTTTTTLLAVILLAIIGVPSIREFIIPLIFGIVSGTYTSIFIAPSIWALMFRPSKKDKLKNQNISEQHSTVE